MTEFCVTLMTRQGTELKPPALEVAVHRDIEMVLKREIPYMPCHSKKKTFFFNSLAPQHNMGLKEVWQNERRTKCKEDKPKTNNTTNCYKMIKDAKKFHTAIKSF